MLATGLEGIEKGYAFIKNKKIEWEQYRAQVTDYELKKYLPIL